MTKFRIAEIFGKTVQGEGFYSGIHTVWVRYFGCNFQCQGFNQKNPRDPSTWVNEYENIDLTGIKTMDDIPVLKYGCDSAYAFAKRFSHLALHLTASEICDKLEEFLYDEEFNSKRSFLHAKSGQDIHLAFTGGEPLLQQSSIIQVMEEFETRKNLPKFVTIETNGTQVIREPFKTIINNKNIEWFWSVSPKLSASGEPWDKAIRPEVVAEYAAASKHGQLKFVVDGSNQCWDEVSEAIEQFRKHGVLFPVWIMPVGSTNEQQREIQAEICDETTRRGYYFSARVHSLIYGNRIGK